MVVLGCCLLVVVMKFQDKFASLQQLNSPNSQDKFQLCWHVFDKISGEFCDISRVDINFVAPRPC